MLVGTGEPTSLRTSSGTTSYLLNALKTAGPDRLVAAISAKPSILARVFALLVAFSPNRDVWHAKFRFGRVLCALRSLARDRRVRRTEADRPYLIHALGFFYLPSKWPYLVYTDATTAMLQGAKPRWTAPPRLHAQRMRMEREYYEGARAIFTMGHQAALSLQAEYSIPADKIHVVGGGVALHPVEPPVWPRPGHTVVFVGLEVERKGLPELINAFEMVRAELPDAVLKVVGAKPPTTERGSVEALGFVGDRARLSRLYLGSTVFCLPARQESFGHVVVEAMAHALPCVVTNVGELPRMVADGVNGYVVPVGATEQLADRLIQILRDPELAKSMGLESARRAEAFDWHRVVNSMLEFIDHDD